MEGVGDQQDYGMRIYDPRIGKFLSVDPLAASYPGWSPYPFAMNRPIDGVDQDGLEWAPSKDNSGHISDYSWVGYNNDGSAKAGSVASAFLDKGDFSYRYSSNARDRSGQINIYSNTSSATNHGWWIDKSTAFNYTINIKGEFVSGLQGGWGYKQTAQINDPGTGANSESEVIGASNDRANPKGVSSGIMFTSLKHAFGVGSAPSDAIESDGIGPLDYFLGVGEFKIANAERKILGAA